MLMSYVPVLNSVLLPLWSVKFYNFLPNSKSQRDLRVFCNKEISVVAALGSTCLLIETLLLIEMNLSRPATFISANNRHTTPVVRTSRTFGYCFPSWKS